MGLIHWLATHLRPVTISFIDRFGGGTMYLRVISERGSYNGMLEALEDEEDE